MADDTTAQLQPNTIFATRYRIIKCIAAGGMGAVYDVLHLETERRRALKVMLPHVLDSEELRQRFKREAKIAAAVDSEFIVDVFDAGIDEATQMPFLVMELLKGEDLSKHLDRRTRFSFVDTVTYLHQTSVALDKTHKASIVHRDLKPENLFLTEREDGSPRIKVLDFGIAKLVEQDQASAKATRAFMGTPLYMSPEQYRGDKSVSSASDIYAIGMMAFTFLTGKPYWFDEASGDGNVYEFAITAMRGPPEPATIRAERYGATLPHAFNLWFARATHVDPAQRFQIAGAAIVEFADVLGVESPAQRTGLPESATMAVGMSPSKFPPALRALASGGTTPLYEADSGAPTPPIPKSNAGIFVAIAALTLLGGGALAFFLLRHPPERSDVSEAATSAEVASAAPTMRAASADDASTTNAPVAPSTSVAAAPAPTRPVDPIAASEPTPRKTTLNANTTRPQAGQNKPAPPAARPTPPPATPPVSPPPQPTYTRD